MAEVVPINFPIPMEKAIASYNYTDIDSGSGYVTYYLMRVNTSGSDKYLLTPTSSSAGALDSNGNSFQATTYVNFDITFNIPRVVKGAAYLSGEVYHPSDDGKIIASLYHYDGSTETEIGEETTSVTITEDQPYCIAFDVSETKFKKGDTLRLKLKVSASQIRLSVDPSGTVYGILPSRLVVPFKIDL